MLFLQEISNRILNSDSHDVPRLRRDKFNFENNYGKLERAREFPRWPSVKAAGGLHLQLSASS